MKSFWQNLWRKTSDQELLKLLEREAAVYHRLVVSEKKWMKKIGNHFRLFFIWLIKLFIPDRLVRAPNLSNTTKQLLKDTDFRFYRFVLALWLIVGVLVGGQLFVFFLGGELQPQAMSPWTQTDWSGGVGSNTTDEYQSATDIDDSTSGEFILAEESGWFDSDWDYRQPVNLTNGGGAQTDFQIGLTVTYDADMQSDFDDLRFANASGTELDFWLESKTDSVSADVWVEVDSIPAGASTIYMYYGNGSATSASSGSDTFIFYDDFETFSGWTTQGSGSVVQDGTQTFEGSSAGHKITNNDPNGAYKAIGSTLSRGFIFEAYVSRNSGYAGGASDRIGVIDGSGNGYGYNYTHSSTTISIDERSSFTGTGNGAVTASPSVTDSFVLTRLTIPASGAITAERYVSGVLSGSTSFTDATVNSFTNVYIFGGHDFWVDAARVRKHAATTPTSGFGSEEDRFVSTGTLTSNIFDSAFVAGADWGTATFTTSGSGTVEVRMRTDNDSGMAGAPAFGTCTAIVSGADISSNNCVDDAERYIQYQVTLAPSGADTPVFEEITTLFVASNEPPDTPTNFLPSNGATQQDTNVTLEGSAFSDSDIGDTHADTQWEVDNNFDFSSPEWTRTAGSGEVTTEVNTANGTFANDLAGETELAEASVYYWRVRYSDNNGLYSSYSTGTNFVTDDPSAGSGSPGDACQNIVVNSYAINTGDAITGDQDVMLHVSASGADEMIFSESIAFADATWVNYQEQAPWTLSDGDGMKTVYVQLRNYCRIGLLMSDTIELQAGYVAPEPEETPVDLPDEVPDPEPEPDVPPVLGPGTPDEPEIIEVPEQPEQPEDEVEVPADDIVTNEPVVVPEEVEDVADVPAVPPAVGVPAPSVVFVPTQTPIIPEDVIVLSEGALPPNLDVYQSGFIVTQSTVTTLESQFAFVSALTNTQRDFYTGAALTFATGELAGETRQITAYDPATGRVTLDAALPQEPNVGDAFTLVRVQEPSAEVVESLTLLDSQVESVVEDVRAVRNAFVWMARAFVVSTIGVWALVLYALWRHQIGNALLFIEKEGAKLLHSSQKKK